MFVSFRWTNKADELVLSRNEFCTDFRRKTMLQFLAHFKEWPFSRMRFSFLPVLEHSLSSECCTSALCDCIFDLVLVSY